MNIRSSTLLVLLALLAFVGAASAQTVREQIRDPQVKVYTVVFGITIDADSKLASFKVSKVVDPKSGKADGVDVPVPQGFVDAARKKVEEKKYEPKLENGKPVEFFTYFFYAPKVPGTVITDLDQPLDKQP